MRMKQTHITQLGLCLVIFITLITTLPTSSVVELQLLILILQTLQFLFIAVELRFERFYLLNKRELILGE